MAPYPIFLRALKTIIMPNFMLLTESEQFKHISALLFQSSRAKTVLTFENDDSNEWYQDKINDKVRTFLYTSWEIARIEGSELLTGN